MQLFNMALVGAIILVIMALVSNTSQTAIENVENQIFLMNCPYPINAGRANNTNIDGLTVNYTLWKDSSSDDYHITTFECTIDPITGNKGASTTVYETANNWFTASTGFLFYVMEGLFAVAGQIQAFLTLFSFILTPANFEILGYTLADLSGVAVAFVVGVYLFSYVFLVAWLYVTFNPFKGSGG